MHILSLFLFQFCSKGKKNSQRVFPLGIFVVVQEGFCTDAGSAASFGHALYFRWRPSVQNSSFLCTKRCPYEGETSSQFLVATVGNFGFGRFGHFLLFAV